MTASNLVQLIGHLGSNPQSITTSKGKMFVKLNLATHEKYTTEQGEAVEKTIWHVVHCNGKQAEWVKSLFSKGDRILIFGKLDSRDWMDKQGITRRSTYVIALEFHRLPSLKSLQQAAHAMSLDAALVEVNHDERDASPMEDESAA